MDACFMGLGYIGLPTAAVAAKSGIDVTGVDINPEVVKTINRGEIHIIEPGLSDVVKDVVTKRKLKAQIKPQESDVFLIVVPTPFKQNHRADISNQWEAHTPINLQTSHKHQSTILGSLNPSPRTPPWKTIH